MGPDRTFKGTGRQGPSDVLRLPEFAQCWRYDVHPAEQAASPRPSLTHGQSCFGVPVSVGVRIYPDETGGAEAGHGLDELLLSQYGVVDPIGLRDDLGESVSVIGAGSVDGGKDPGVRHGPLDGHV
jgi:hypothetical protein